MIEFPRCQPGQVQWRAISSYDSWRGYDVCRSLWRTEYCAPTRWHYWENPCNCHEHRPTLEFFLHTLEFEPVEALPERGTWRRDGRGIAARTLAFRAELAVERKAAAVYSNCGPRPLRTVGHWYNQYGDYEVFP